MYNLYKSRCTSTLPDVTRTKCHYTKNIFDITSELDFVGSRAIKQVPEGLFASAMMKVCIPDNAFQTDCHDKGLHWNLPVGIKNFHLSYFYICMGMIDGINSGVSCASLCTKSVSIMSCYTPINTSIIPFESFQWSETYFRYIHSGESALHHSPETGILYCHLEKISWKCSVGVCSCTFTLY